jgi:hypothetical protein
MQDKAQLEMQEARWWAGGFKLKNCLLATHATWQPAGSQPDDNKRQQCHRNISLFRSDLI